MTRPKTQGWMPRAHYARGEVRGALPRIPARRTPPETPAAFPFRSYLPERSKPSRVRCAEQKTLALDRSGPFPRLAPRRKGGSCKSQTLLRLRLYTAFRWSAPELLNKFRVDKTS